MLGALQRENERAGASVPPKAAKTYGAGWDAHTTSPGDAGKERKKAAKAAARQEKFIASQMKKYDKDSTGYLERGELSKLIADLNDGKSDEATLNFVLKIADSDGNDKLALNELQQALTALNRVSQLSFLDAKFDAFDANKNGKLESAELKKLMEHLNEGHAVGEQEVAKVIDLCDVDADGAIDRSELKPSIAMWYANVKDQGAKTKSKACVIL
eukprot:g3188.t1